MTFLRQVELDKISRNSHWKQEALPISLSPSFGRTLEIRSFSFLSSSLIATPMLGVVSRGPLKAKALPDHRYLPDPLSSFLDLFWIAFFFHAIFSLL